MKYIKEDKIESKSKFSKKKNMQKSINTSKRQSKLKLSSKQKQHEIKSLFVSGQSLLQEIEKDYHFTDHERVVQQQNNDFLENEEKYESDDEKINVQKNDKKKNQKQKQQLQNLEKLFDEEDLYFTKENTITLDLRLPSTSLLQDNMLTTLRLLNCHPFAPLLKIQEHSKDAISIHDLPLAIKTQTISKQSQFETIISSIFRKSMDRLSSLHQKMKDIVDVQKAKFVIESQQEINNGLLALNDKFERFQILKECDLIPQNDSLVYDSQEGNNDEELNDQDQIDQNQQNQKSFNISLSANDADKVLKLRRLLAISLFKNKKKNNEIKDLKTELQ